MTKALTQTENSKKQSDNTKTPPKTFDYKTIVDRLRIVSWSNYSHPTGVIKQHGRLYEKKSNMVKIKVCHQILSMRRICVMN